MKTFFLVLLLITAWCLMLNFPLPESEAEDAGGTFEGGMMKAEFGSESSGRSCYDTDIEKLSPEHFAITQRNGTERPFDNAYWNNKRAGVYVDVVSGEPLFSSQDKYDSGTGWPSFTKPLNPNVLKEKKDSTLGMTRVEVRSSKADSHLGHVFPDGPGPNGLRYCINSASLRFIPVEDLEKEGYGEYLELFSPKPKNHNTERN